MAIRKPMVIFTLVLIILIFAVYKTYNRFHRSTQHQLNADLRWLGVIDLDNTHDVNLNTIMNGEKFILVVDHATLLYQQIAQKIPQAQYLTPEEVLNLANLHLFDKNSDDIISAQDPLYHHLFVIKFNSKGEPNDIMPLSLAGIDAVYTKQTATGGDYQVQMKDGSQHALISPNKLEKN